MLENYCKIAIRTLLKYKTFSLINVAGLAISMSVCLLVIVFYMHQKSYDQFHEKSARIYRVYSDYKAEVNDESHLYSTSPMQLSTALLSGYSGVEEAVRLKKYGGIVSYEGHHYDFEGLYADESFFRVFDFELAKGDKETALSEPFSLILTPEMARRFFGDAAAMGQTVSIAEREFIVTGILDDAPGPSHIKLAGLLSFAALQSDKNANYIKDWHYSVWNTYTFLLLRQDADPADLSAHLSALIAETFPSTDRSWLVDLHLQALTDINLGPELDNKLTSTFTPEFIYALSVMGAIIMLASCLNYTCLSVARALVRAKEVGLRKVVGAYRSQVIGQFLGEAVAVTGVALVVAVLLLDPLVRGFNEMWAIGEANARIDASILSDYRLYLIILSFSLFVALMAGMYPAFYLSRFAPAKVLKGATAVGRRAKFSLWKTLVVVQFSLSLFFIVIAVSQYAQMRYLHEADYGFQRQNIVNIRLRDIPYEIFRQQVENHVGIAQISGASVVPMGGGRSDWWVRTADIAEEKKVYVVYVDYEFIENLGLKLVAGRNFSSDFSADYKEAVIFNEAALRRLEIKNPREALGKSITWGHDQGANQGWMQIVGVVRDYHTRELSEPMDPIALVYDPEKIGFVSLRVHDGQLAAVTEHIETVWPSLNSVHKADYSTYEAMIESELEGHKDTVYILGTIMICAITIACLGLLGIAIYTVERRTKEVGVRKVLGASIADILGLLIKEFAWLIGIAVVLSAPVSWMLNEMLLEEYAYRTDTGSLVLIIGTLSMLVLALATIGSQALKAARQNPVQTMRYE